MKYFYLLISVLVVSVNAFGQATDLAAIYHSPDGEVSHLLFENGAGKLTLADDPFKARAADLAENHPNLALSGNFTGDGLDELAVFYDLKYTPNMTPEFTCSVISVDRSNGQKLIPAGTWFSSEKAQFDFNYVDFSVPGDFNQDGLADIALFYNDTSSQLLSLLVLESSGSGFSAPIPYYITNRDEFNFTALRYACSGDFNGNGLSDIAVFYNYFGNTPEIKQSIYIFESGENAFTLLPVGYEGIKEEHDFSKMAFAQGGDYNKDEITDVAVLEEDPLSGDHTIQVFEGSPSGQMVPSAYRRLPASELDISLLKHAVSGNYAGDEGTDLALFYVNPETGGQEILVLESESSGFRSPVKQYSTSRVMVEFDSISTVRSGHFVHQTLVSATTWKDDKKGAISFTFDDGYRGAFTHGASELDAAGLKGTFYIFTDTAGIYDAELAETGLIREYKNKGFEIGSRTTNLSNLGLLTYSQDFESLSEVLSNSATLLNQRFDQQTISLSLPFGSFAYPTLEYISRYYHTARSSQHGFNLATPFDFHALKSWPILSSTSPAFVEGLISIVESYGYFLPLIYQDILDDPFNEDSLIYSYRKDLFSETVQSISERDIWVDTHGNIYKYIRERNALRIEQVDTRNAEEQPGSFSFVASDGLPDSVFNAELTLKIRLPDSWTMDVASLWTGDSLQVAEVLLDDRGSYLLYNCKPAEGQKIKVYEGSVTATGNLKKHLLPEQVNLTAYPNPFTTESLITIEGAVNPQMQLIFLDMQGRLVKKANLDGNTTFRFNFNHLPPGHYVVQLIDKGLPVASLKLLAQ